MGGKVTSYEIGWHFQIGTMFVLPAILMVSPVLVCIGVDTVTTAGNPHLGVCHPVMVKTDGCDGEMP
jgi:hypothetical protein